MFSLNSRQHKADTATKPSFYSQGIERVNTMGWNFVGGGNGCRNCYTGGRNI